MGSGPSRTRAGVLGRDAEIEQVRAALDAVAGLSGRGLLITGEAGIGKSRLLDVVVQSAGDRFRVVTEAASELETELPFAPLIRGLGLRPDSADPAAATVGRLLTRGEVTDPELLRLQVIGGIVDLVERWAIERPVLLAVDDLHWADDATLQSLDRMSRRLQHVGVLVAGTARPHPRPAALRALERTFANAGAVTIELSPLSEGMIDELARQIVGGQLGPRLSTALRQAGGNPLYAEELLAAAGSDGPDGDHVAELPPGEMPSSVRQAILRNLESLPGPALDVLRMASVLGTRFDLRQLALTLDRTEAEVVDLLRPAFDSGVVSGAGEHLAFRHDLVREAAYQDQPAAVRAAGHRHVVERLRSARLPVEDVVPHLLRGRWGSVPEAATWLADAGRAMRSRHLPVAAQLLGRALELTGDDLSPELRLEYADVLAADNRMSDLAGVLQPLLDAPPTTLSQAVRDRLVRFAAPTVAPSLTTSQRRNLLDTMEASGLSEAGRIRAMGLRAATRWFEGRPAEAEDLARRALADEAVDPALASELELVLARLAEGRGQRALKLAHARRAHAHAKAVPSQPELGLNAAATLAIMLGTDVTTQDEAVAVVADAQTLADRTGLEFHQTVLEAVAGLTADRRGAWDDAATSYDSAIGSIRDLATVPATAAQLYARAARLHLHRNDVPLAIDRLRVAQEIGSRAQSEGERPDELCITHLAEAEVGVAVGDPAAAREGLRAFASFVDARAIGIYHVTMLPFLTAISVGIGDPSEAQATVERAERWMSSGDHSDDHLEGVVRWCRGLVDGDDGAMEELVMWVEEPRPIWEWKPRAREDAASVFAAVGRRKDAVEQLRAALGLWEGVGARRDVARIRRTLRGLGVRGGRGLAADRPRQGWASVTDAEWRVLELVSEGLIYREIAERLFISRRTVETHVQHLFQKLGVSSRTELTRMVAAECGERPAQHRRGRYVATTDVAPAPARHRGT